MLAGEELIRVFRPDADGRVKAFCSACGSSLFGAEWPEGDEIPSDDGIPHYDEGHPGV